MKEYSVQKLATLTGVTPRTLHYYDQIGLLRPSRIGDNGYRFYDEKSLTTLQLILFFKELAFSLEDIRLMITNPIFNSQEALQDQKVLFKLEIRRLKSLIATIDKTLQHMKGGVPMSDDTLYNGLTKEEIAAYKKEVKEKWGDKELKQSGARMRNWSKDEQAAIMHEGEEIATSLASMMDNPIGSKDVQDLIAKHFAHINKFYDCTKDIYLGLSHLYIDDERFAKHFNAYRKGLASFLSEAMQYYCKHSLS